MDDPFSLVRFRTAQDEPARRGSVYETALAELHNGRKRTHWMWFVFPQLAGLGRSDTARFFAISGRDEAVAYLADPVLGARLDECARAAVGSPAGSATDLLGEVDAAKLRSSATLFHAVGDGRSAFADVFAEVLARFFDGRPDPETVRLLG